MSRAWSNISWYRCCYYVCGFLVLLDCMTGKTRRRIVLQKLLHLPVSSLTVPHSDYKSLVRIQALGQWQLRWNSETENKPNSIEPTMNVINTLRLPRRDEIIIHRLRTHILLVDTYFEGRFNNPLGAWLVKWI